MKAALRGENAPTNHNQLEHWPNTRQPIRIPIVQIPPEWHSHSTRPNWLARCQLLKLSRFATWIGLLFRSATKKNFFLKLTDVKNEKAWIMPMTTKAPHQNSTSLFIWYTGSEYTWNKLVFALINERIDCTENQKKIRKHLNDLGVQQREYWCYDTSYAAGDESDQEETPLLSIVVEHLGHRSRLGADLLEWSISAAALCTYRSLRLFTTSTTRPPRTSEEFCP